MTPLSAISLNHLALECRSCGRWRLASVRDLIDRFDGDRTVHWIAERCVCTRCGTIGARLQITYVGASESALAGARGLFDGLGETRHEDGDNGKWLPEQGSNLRQSD